jgi:transcriptional regulator with XRE-family HTH domain
MAAHCLDADEMKLATWRSGKGWTQEQTAEHAGVDRVSWCRWETGARIPTLKTAQRIVEFTGGEVTFADLLTSDTSGAGASDGAGG